MKPTSLDQLSLESLTALRAKAFASWQENTDRVACPYHAVHRKLYLKAERRYSALLHRIDEELGRRG